MVTDSARRAWSDLPISPGELLEEELAARGMSQRELAARTGRPPQAINEIVRDRKRITHATAIEMEKALGIPAHIWTELESTYQLTRARLREKEELSKQRCWLKRFPLAEMVRLGWIEEHSTAEEMVRELLGFLGMASFDAWRSRQVTPAFRITPGSKVSQEALAAWLRKGELDGQEAGTTPYDAGRFRQVLGEIRGLTTETPEVFVPQIQASCASAGVAVAFVPELPKSGASGVARWLTRQKALIQLSLRYKTNDHLWFSFFHEAAHVLRHRVRHVFIDSDDRAWSDEEDEADEFARDILIPPARWGAFIATRPRSRAAVEGFARTVAIAPGIVVGRLQHEKVIPHKNLNGLKVRLQWSIPA